MNSDDWDPEIIVGIDFGMTCTGVAYSSAPDWHAPKALQHWPSRMISELANKVPSYVEYHSGSPQVRSWGFMSDIADTQADIKGCFKLHLDSQYTDPRPGAPRTEEARQWYRDYLRCIHSHVIGYLSNSFPRFNSRRVEFIFSVPTTWKSPSMIAEIEKLIESAGFGHDAPNHRAGIGLTEAEAAAVYASKQNYQRGDVILICDAGGGTTDVNVLKLDSSPGEATKLRQLCWVEGQPIGSTFIDVKMVQLLEERLDKIRDQLAKPPKDIASAMTVGRFERFKCAFGTEASSLTPTLRLDIPGLRPGLDFPYAGISNSQMIITSGDIRRIFDALIADLYTLIDGQLQRMQTNHPHEQISYLVLSGGFGSSVYVKNCLRSRYENPSGARWPNALDMAILTADEPQLAVVQGLVLERSQQIGRGAAIFQERCCRISYGIICRQPYDPRIHIGEPVTYDSRDRRMWANNQIDWVIKQGSTISCTGMSRAYMAKFNPVDGGRPWKAQIVMSSLPADQLPQSLNRQGAKTVCAVESTLQDVELKLKNRHWYNRGEKYWRAKFDVKVILGPADLKFQLWSKGGRIISRDHEVIAVKWDPPKETVEDDSTAMYRE